MRTACCYLDDVDECSVVADEGDELRNGHSLVRSIIHLMFH